MTGPTSWNAAEQHGTARVLSASPVRGGTARNGVPHRLRGALDPAPANCPTVPASRPVPKTLPRARTGAGARLVQRIRTERRQAPRRLSCAEAGVDVGDVADAVRLHGSPQIPPYCGEPGTRRFTTPRCGLP